MTLPRRLPAHPAPAAQPCSARAIPALAHQPDRAVRIAYWWALALQCCGWTLHACGQDVARHGFIAEIPRGGCHSTLVIYPGDCADDGSAAAALARQLARLGVSQRRQLRHILSAHTAGPGQVI